MRKAFTAVALLTLFSASLYAADRPQRFQKRGGVTFRKADVSREWVDRVFGQARQANRKDVGASAVIANSSSRQLVVPSAGSVRGANNTFYRSDVTIVNYNDDDQEIAVFWFPNGGNPDAIDVAFIDIPGATPPITIEDFVGTVMQQSGVGSLIFFPIIGEDFDPNGAIDVFSRIWSPQPGTNGVVSFPFPAVDINHLTSHYEAIILGLRQDADHRTNYGVVNLGNTDLTFQAYVVNEDGFLAETSEFTLPAGSMIQTSVPAGNFGNFSLLVNVLDEVPNDDFVWTAYASSNNNFSQDGWVSIAANLFDDDDLDTLSTRVPPGK